MKLDFYYWSYQCPLHADMLQLLKTYEDKLDIYYHDIDQNHSLAKEMNMYFPTLIVINDIHRYFEPLRKSFLEEIVKGNLPSKTPYQPMQSNVHKSGTIVPITSSNLIQACECSGGCHISSSSCKKMFYQSKSQAIIGFMLVDEGGSLLGGAEYISSLEVPYDIPKQASSAFMTCVYMSSEEYDAKSEPLQTLENYLKEQYNDLYVISDETGTFPNGDISFFLSNGYMDKGIISKEEGYCTLHLLYKIL